MTEFCTTHHDYRFICFFNRSNAQVAKILFQNPVSNNNYIPIILFQNSTSNIKLQRSVSLLCSLN